MSNDFEKRKLFKVLKLLFNYQEGCPLLITVIISFFATIVVLVIMDSKSPICDINSSLLSIHTTLLGFSIATISILASMLPNVIATQEKKSKEVFYSVSASLALNIPLNIMSIILIFIQIAFDDIIYNLFYIEFFFLSCCLIWALHTTLHIFSITIPKNNNQ